MISIETIQRRIGDCERALAELATRRSDLATELEEAGDAGPKAAFATLAATGELASASRTAEAVEADLAHVDAMIAAGEAQITGFRRQLVDVRRVEQAARVAGMTMSDALAFAREGLKAVDLAAARAELDRIEGQIEALDEPRIAARDASAKATRTAHDLAMRYRGLPDQRTGLTREAATAASAEALERVSSLRDRSRSLQRLHEQTRDELKSAVIQALAYVGRLTAAAAIVAEKHASALATFARGLASERTTFLPLPTAPKADDLPSDGAIVELKSLAEPILTLSRRAAPPSRPESAYSPPALR